MTHSPDSPRKDVKMEKTVLNGAPAPSIEYLTQLVAQLRKFALTLDVLGPGETFENRRAVIQAADELEHLSMALSPRKQSYRGKGNEMKLDRNIDGNNGTGKYALIALRPIKDLSGKALTAVEDALDTLSAHGLLQWGRPHTESEFFVLKLRDQFAEPALVMYAHTAMLHGDKEYAREVKELADRSGTRSPFCKRPD